MCARVRRRPVERERPGERRHWSLAVALVAVGTVWVTVTGGPWAQELVGTASGDGVFPLVAGLAVGHDADGAIRRLIEQVRRLEAGEYDLDLPTDREDGLGQLATELDDLAASLAADERSRSDDEKRFEAVFEDPGMLVGLLDPDGTHRHSNETAMSYIDADRDEVDGVPFWETPWWEAHDEAQRMIRETIERAAAGEYVSYEADLTDGSGDRFYREGTVRPVTEEGEVVSLVVSARDVTEREEQKRDLERYRTLVNAMRDSACIYDEDGRIEVANRALANFYETTPEELKGRRSYLVERLRAESEGDPYRELVEGNRDELCGEYAATYPEAGYAVVEYRMTRLTVDGEFDGIVAIARDITERREHERRLRAIVENTLDPIYIKDREGRYQFVNEAGAAFLDLDRDEVIGKTDRDLFDEEGTVAIEDDREVLETGESIVVERTRRIDGEDVVFLDNKYPYRDEDGEIVGVIGISRDITERKERERKLRERERELSTLMGNIPGMVYRCTNEPNWPFEFVSEGCRAVTGYDPETIESGAVSWSDDVIAGDNEELWTAVQRAIETGDPFQVTYLIEDADGERRWLWEQGRGVYDDAGDPEALEGVIMDVTDRKERQRELERAKDLLALAGGMATIGGWSVDLSGDPPYTPEWTAQLYEIFEVSPDRDLTVEDVYEFYHPDDRERGRRVVERAVETGQGWDEELRIVTAEGAKRWVRTIGEAISEDGVTVEIHGSVQDITDQKRRELALRSLHDAARQLLGTETEADVADLVVDVATEVVDTDAVGLYLLNSETNTLEPTAVTDAFADRWDEAPSVAVGDADSLIWNTFVTETRTVVENGDVTDDTGLFDGVRNGVLVPVGDHGVFVALSPAERIDATTRQLVETLVATTEAALDRLTSQATLRERDAELEARNERLRRQMQITEIIRSIDQSLIGAATHEEIERDVCERLVADDTIGFAWIGALGPDGESVTAREWAGDGERYLDAISADGSATTPEPAWQAARTESPVVVENVVDDLQQEGWRKPALAQNFHSVVAVPLVFDEYSYGVLAVYATEPDAFGDLERSVFTELGESIANSITAAKTRQALHAETLLELELALTDADDLLARIAREADCRVEYEGLATVPDDDDRVFFLARDTDPDTVRAVLADLVSVTDTRLVSDADGLLFEVTTAAPLVAAKLVSHGGRPQSITADPTGMDVVVDLPTSTDVREFVEMLREDNPSVELTARRHVERPTQTRRELVTTLFDSLTDRQREVLETAYLAGFFEQPRETTGEELAEMLGVSQPTVNRHLRLAQQRLMEQLFSTGERAET
ncbi:hypothetical protein BV210_09365 [Halorientalis sp. IM1011]|uniref:PAS domain S-box protein n=1 Tax=Halorientalis sp. IM1011 TaxID=1932360 RepID=UPI00097CC191|nr:PAS domain S-box protein [Halorientalis sp. IM1011]AQL42910.1 hypothetical protein BV210_09365 [Halorientalis sp. IM1011]